MSSRKRPDYVVCVANEPNNNLSYCENRNLQNEFHFLNPAHAINNAYTEGRLQICPDCASLMIQYITDGTYDDDTSN